MAKGQAARSEAGHEVHRALLLGQFGWQRPEQILSASGREAFQRNEARASGVVALVMDKGTLASTMGRLVERRMFGLC